MRDWEKAYQNYDTPWDHGEAAPPLREYLRSNVIQGSVLVPGCGTGHDVRLLSRHGARSTGLDLAPSAIKKASTFPKASDEKYMLGDFLKLPKPLVSAFDWVFEHTCLCALDPIQREAYVSAVHRALKPGGQLLGIFFCVVEDYDGKGPPHPISPEEINTLFESKFITLSSWTPTQTYASRSGGKEQMRLMKRLG